MGIEIFIIFIFILFIISIAILWSWYLRTDTLKSKKAYKTALKALQRSNYAQAERLLKKAIHLNKKNTKALFQLGQTYLKQKKYELAQACFEKIVKYDAKNVDAKFWLAFTLQKLKKNDEAEILYKSVLKEKPNHYDCIIQIGELEFEKENYLDALDNFKKAQSLSPDDKSCRFYITKCKDKLCTYETKDDGKSIIDEYLKLMNEKDLPKEFFITVATAFARTGQIQEALKFCQKSLEKNSEDFESYKLLGLIQLIYKDFEGVKNTLATAISLQSNNAEVHTLLSYALCQQDNRCSAKVCRDKYSEIIKKFIKSDENEDDNTEDSNDEK
ncbi:tetratricopeptide repeat protein [bacterium]|nr:tetratricopeptide repeat protein [bacterium]